MLQARILAARFNSEIRNLETWIEENGGTMLTANATSRPAMISVSPFFIVRDLERALSFYRDSLGFDVAFRAPDAEPFFAVVRRDGVQFLLKVVGPDVAPLPNCQRHPWARWDAYVSVPDPDALSTELASRGVTFSAPIAD